MNHFCRGLLTRREALAAAGAFGASLAFGGISCTQNKRKIEGSIVGANDTRAHLLRSALPPPGASPPDSAEIVIIGGGVAGLCAAWKLSKSNFNDFLLLDLEDGLGGTAASGSNSICNYPWGAHYVPIPTREQRTLCELLQEAGVIRGFEASGRAVPVEDYVCRAPEERLFYKGSWYEGLYLKAGASADDLQQFERFDREMRSLATARGADGKRIFTIPTAACSADPTYRALDDLSMAAWLDSKNYNSPRLRWYVEYACRDDFGCYLSDVSAWAALHYFCSRLPTAESDAAEFLTWPEGNGFLVHYLSKFAAGRVRTGALATAVTASGDSVRVDYYDFKENRARSILTKHAICASPQYVTKRIVPESAPHREKFCYSPWAVANLSLASPPPENGFPLAWDNVLYESESLGYVVATHQLDRRDPGSVWTWYRPFCSKNTAAARAEVLAYDFDRWKNEILKDLTRAHRGIENHITNIDVYRYGHAMIRPEPGFLFSKERARAAVPIGNIHFAAADLGGLPLFEEAQWAGVRAAEEALAALGRSFTSSL